VHAQNVISLVGGLSTAGTGRSGDQLTDGACRRADRSTAVNSPSALTPNPSTCYGSVVRS
jgi:hypothetical protein